MARCRMRSAAGRSCSAASPSTALRRSVARSRGISNRSGCFALQGVSSGAGLVVGRAIIRDRFEGPDAQRLMSQITLVFGIAPALAPVIGGALLNLLGWRTIFWLMLAFSTTVCAWAARSLPETLPRDMRQSLR